jgi:hypothetical protein
MILPSTLWLLCSSLALAATTPAELFLFDPAGHSTERSILSDNLRPETAKLILSQRLGFSDHYSLAGSDVVDIEQIDAFGGPRQHPFSLSKQEDVLPRVLLVIEGDLKWFGEDIMAPVGEKALTGLHISPAPQSRYTAEFMEELMTESRRYSALDTSGQASWRNLEILAVHADNRIVKHAGRTIAYVKSPMVGGAAFE